MSPGSTSLSRQGNYAGAVSRMVAFAADVAIAWFSLLVILWLISMAISIVIPENLSLGHGHRIVIVIAVVIWFPTYFAYQWSLGGKTLGMAIFGLRVVSAEGAPISPKAAAVRTITLPISIAVAGLGLVGIVLRVDHRAWHDRFAKTCVVYDWDARAARLLWLARQHDLASGSARTPLP